MHFVRYRQIYTKLGHIFSSLRTRVNTNQTLFLRNTFSSVFFPIENVKALKNDTILYTLEKAKVIRYATILGVGQFAVCTFLGLNAFLSLKDTGHIEPSEGWKKNLNLGDVKYRITAGLGCISIGFLTAVIAYKLPSRIVKQLTLCKGGNTVSFETYGPFGKTNSFNSSLQQLTCLISRNQATSYIPIKVKNTWFYYLIDCKGKFHQPALFDVTVGTKSWK